MKRFVSIALALLMTAGLFSSGCSNTPQGRRQQRLFQRTRYAGHYLKTLTSIPRTPVEKRIPKSGRIKTLVFETLGHRQRKQHSPRHRR